MMKSSAAVLLLTVVAGTLLAAAQNSKASPASIKPAPDPMKNVTKPLTPKSAMPAKRRPAAVPLNAPQAGNRNTAELARLEEQNAKAATPKSSPAAPKIAPVKSAGTPANGSGINFKYQKPVGGKTAAPPGANAKASPTPRVNPH